MTMLYHSIRIDLVPSAKAPAFLWGFQLTRPITASARSPERARARPSHAQGRAAKLIHVVYRLNTHLPQLCRPIDWLERHIHGILAPRLIEGRDWPRRLQLLQLLKWTEWSVGRGSASGALIAL
jgi:hypothetical protein